MKNFKIATLLFVTLLFPSMSFNETCELKRTILFTDAASPALHQPLIQSIPQQTNIEKEIFKWFRTISEVIYLIVEKHYNNCKATGQKDKETIDIPAFIQYALKAAVPTIDPHSSFFPKESYKAALESTSGKFSGIGISIMNKAAEEDSLAIIEVIRGGPSDKAGLRAGDQIIAIDDKPLTKLSSDDVITKLRGQIGTSVKIKILRDKKPLDFTITREEIKDQNLFCYHFKNPNIYYFALKLFADNTHIHMEKFLKKALEANCNGLIIDLRRNPGGVLDSAVNMVGLFVDKGSLVVATKDKTNKVIDSYRTTSNPIFKKNIPVLLLTDNFTASASEIFTGCLKYYANQNNNLLVLHVGTETFGKGSVQEVIPISNGCALKLTTMMYALPDDTLLQAKGIAPDFTIKQKIMPEKDAEVVTTLYGKEEALQNHILLHEKKNQPVKPKKEELAKNWEKQFQEALCHDSQIQACINMINMLKIMPKTIVYNRQNAISFLKQNYFGDEETALTRIE